MRDTVMDDIQDNGNGGFRGAEGQFRPGMIRLDQCGAKRGLSCYSAAMASGSRVRPFSTARLNASSAPS